jgi:hypothetical protein
LQAAEHVTADIGELIGGDRKVAHGDAILGREHDLALGARDVHRKATEQRVGGVAELADMQVVERGIIFRTGADRGTADRDGQIEFMSAAADVVHLLALDMHAADEHGFRPLEIGFGRGRQVLVDEADLPLLGQIGRKHQQPLRRHEGFLAVGQGVGIFERTE